MVDGYTETMEAFDLTHRKEAGSIAETICSESDLTSPSAVPPLKRAQRSISSGQIPQWDSNRTSSKSLDPTLLRDSLKYEYRATVVGYSKSSDDDVVYYEVLIERTSLGPLSVYKVRRRFTEFRKLYQGLLRYATKHRLEHNLPRFPANSQLYSYVYRHDDELLAKRQVQFNDILNAVQANTLLAQAPMFIAFLGTPPDCNREAKYVSLKMYSAPRLDLFVEQRERRKRASSARSERLSQSNDSFVQAA